VGDEFKQGLPNGEFKVGTWLVGSSRCNQKQICQNFLKL
jgi:hypothetical protein